MSEYGPVEEEKVIKAKQRYRVKQDMIAAELTSKKKEFCQCPKCHSVFKGAYAVVVCNGCGYRR